jgi:hypothetical protein
VLQPQQQQQAHRAAAHETWNGLLTWTATSIDDSCACVVFREIHCEILIWNEIGFRSRDANSLRDVVLQLLELQQ